MHRRGRQLFAQAGKHRRNALLQRFDELLVHFEHLLQIGRRSIFHVIARASGAGHGELRCQSGGNIMGGNFIPMAGDGKQANCCRAPWLWARNGLSRSAHVSESRRTSVHHDTARGYRDHSRVNTPSPAQTVSVQNAIAVPFLRGQSATRSSARKQMPFALLACGSMRALCTRPWYGRAFA